MSSTASSSPSARAASSWRFPAELRFGTAREVLEAASAALESSQPRFDLSACERFDSSLIAVLLELQRRAAARGRKCRFEAPTEKVLKLVTLYGVESLLFDAVAVRRTAPATLPVR